MIKKHREEFEVEPTYIGKNEELQFNYNTSFMELKPSAENPLTKEQARKFSKDIRETFSGWDKSRQTKYDNINTFNTKTTPIFWQEFERVAREMDVDIIGYMPVLEEYIFYNLKVYGKNAIILGQEMKWEKIKTAPSIIAATEFFRLQNELGKTVMALTKYLQERGYKSESHVPFGGKLLVPAHVVKAGLAIKGQNGITVTPEFGQRQRWGIISTDAEIPETPKRDLSELEEFCKNCGLCVKDCLANAVFEKPIERKGGVLKHIVWEKCMETLREKNYFSVCLKVCPPGIPKKE